MKFNDFIKKCYENEIIKSITIFVVSCWTVIQVSHVTHDAVGLPEEFVSVLIILFFLLTPFYLYYAWQKHGKKDQPAELDDTQRHEARGFKVMYFRVMALASAFCLFMVFFVASNKFFNKNKFEIRAEDNKDKIAVLSFKNRTLESDYEIIGKMAADRIAYGITQKQIAQVISSDVVDGYATMMQANQMKTGNSDFLRTYLQPGRIISGSFYEDDGKFLFESSLINGETNEIIYSFQQESCDITSPLDCIEQLKQVILSYLSDRDKSTMVLEQNPPKFEAYRYMLEAKELRNPATSEYISLLQRAIQEDEAYFEPKVARIGYYYNVGDYDTADSLVNEINLTDIEDDRQKNILRLYQNLLAGKYANVYRFMKSEYELAPYDFENNNSLMIIALEFVNLPEVVPDIAKEISADLVNTKDCAVCVQRVKVLMDAHLRNNAADSVINLYDEFTELQPSATLFRPLLTAWIQKQDFEQVSALYNDAARTLSFEELESLTIHIQNQMVVHGLRENLATLGLKRVTSETNVFWESVFLGDDLEKAKTSISENADQQLIFTLLKMDDADALTQMNELSSTASRTDYGWQDYQFARYHMLSGNEEAALTHLKRSVEKGSYFTDYTFKNDGVFEPLFTNPEFENILSYWTKRL